MTAQNSDKYSNSIPNNPETQNPGQQQHRPQEEEGFLLFFLVSTSRHCPPPLGHWGGAASESPAGESRGSLRAPRKYVTAAVSWILLTEATDKTRTFWSNLSHPGGRRNNPRTQSLVLFHEMEIGTRYQKPTDKKCDSFFVKFWPNCFYDVLRFTYLLGLQHQQIGDIFAGFMAVCNSFFPSLFCWSFLKLFHVWNFTADWNKYPLASMGSSLTGLRTWDPPLSPPSTLAEIFQRTWLQNHL